MQLLTIISNIVAAFVVFVFLLSGLVQVSKVVDPDTYIVMDELFRNTCAPVWQHIIDRSGISYTIDPVIFKCTVGYTQLLAVSIMLIGYTRLAMIILMTLMVGALITHVMADQEFFFPLLLLGLCIGLFLTSKQTRR